MTAIWQNDGEAWKLLSPIGFPAEAALHDIVAQAPELLPLSGKPPLAVLGREIQLGSGYADVLAVEDTGRLVVIEVKLGRNSEARRAVVAQVLAYAAYLHDMSLEELDRRVLDRGGVAVCDQAFEAFTDAGVERTAFEEGVRSSLDNGWFRIVLVLDEAPEDLVRLVGYLEMITDEQITIDLVTVASYDVNGSRVVVPQRIDSRARESVAPARDVAIRSSPNRSASAPIVTGTAPFEDFITETIPEYHDALRRLLAWAKDLEVRGLAKLRTSIGSGRRVLRVQVPGEDASIIAVWAEVRRPGVSFHLSVAARRAPQTADLLRSVLPGVTNPYLGVDEVTESVLDVAAAAYREASTGQLRVQDAVSGDPPGSE